MKGRDSQLLDCSSYLRSFYAPLLSNLSWANGFLTLHLWLITWCYHRSREIVIWAKKRHPAISEIPARPTQADFRFCLTCARTVLFPMDYAILGFRYNTSCAWAKHPLRRCLSGWKGKCSISRGLLRLSLIKWMVHLRNTRRRKMHWNISSVSSSFQRNLLFKWHLHSKQQSVCYNRTDFSLDKARDLKHKAWRVGGFGRAGSFHSSHMIFLMFLCGGLALTCPRPSRGLSQARRGGGKNRWTVEILTLLSSFFCASLMARTSGIFVNKFL